MILTKQYFMIFLLTACTAINIYSSRLDNIPDAPAAPDNLGPKQTTQPKDPVAKKLQILDVEIDLIPANQLPPMPPDLDLEFEVNIAFSGGTIRLIPMFDEDSRKSEALSPTFDLRSRYKELNARCSEIILAEAKKCILYPIWGSELETYATQARYSIHTHLESATASDAIESAINASHHIIKLLKNQASNLGYTTPLPRLAYIITSLAPTDQKELFDLCEQNLKLLCIYEKKDQERKGPQKPGSPLSTDKPTSPKPGPEDKQSFLASFFIPPRAPKVNNIKLSEALQLYNKTKKSTRLWCLSKMASVGTLSAAAGYFIGRKFKRPVLVSSLAGLTSAGVTWLGLRMLNSIKQQRKTHQTLIQAKRLFDDLDPVLEKKAIQDACTQKIKKSRIDGRRLIDISTLLEKIIDQQN